LNFTLTTTELLPEPSDRLGWLRVLLSQRKTISRPVPALSPKIDRVQIEHGRIAVGLRKAALNQVR
jgi:hypothetical protein